MKRFIVFGGPDYYPSGGMEDFRESFESLPEAVNYARKIIDPWSIDWSHIYDLNEHRVVAIFRIGKKEETEAVELDKYNQFPWVR